MGGNLSKNLKPYPNWVCKDCGRKASGGKQYSCSTWNMAFPCGVCGRGKEDGVYVTEPRDFFYPQFKGHDYK